MGGAWRAISRTAWKCPQVLVQARPMGHSPAREQGRGRRVPAGPVLGPLPTGPEVPGHRPPLGSDLGSVTRLLHAFTQFLHFLPLTC